MHRKADVARWMHGHRAAQRRTAHEARRSDRDFEDALSTVDDLRRLADDLGATAGELRRKRENLEFHLAWRRVRRAFGVG